MNAQARNDRREFNAYAYMLARVTPEPVPMVPVVCTDDDSATVDAIRRERAMRQFAF